MTIGKPFKFILLAIHLLTKEDVQKGVEMIKTIALVVGVTEISRSMD